MSGPLRVWEQSLLLRYSPQELKETVNFIQTSSSWSRLGSSSRKWIVNRRWLNLQPIVYFEMLFLQLSNLYANEYTITEELRVVKRKRLEKKGSKARPRYSPWKKVGFLRFANCLGNFGSISYFWEKFNDRFNFKSVAEGVVFSAVLLKR